MGQSTSALQQTDDIPHLAVQALNKRPANLTLVAKILKAMAHPLRLKIICTLGDQEFNVKELMVRVGTTQSNLSQHLGLLRRSNLIRVRRLGYHSLYRLNHGQTMEVINCVHLAFCQKLRRR